MVRKAAGDGKTTDAEEDRLRHTKSKRAGMWEHQTLNLFFPLGPLTCSLRSNATSLQDVKKKKKVFATCIFPRVFRFSLLNSFPLTITLLLPSLSLSTTFTALLFTAPVILFQEMEEKYRVKINGGTGIRGNNIMTHTKKRVKRYYEVNLNNKEAKRWGEMKGKKRIIFSIQLVSYPQLLSPNIMNLTGWCSVLLIKHTHTTHWFLALHQQHVIKMGPLKHPILPPLSFPQSHFLYLSVLLSVTFIKKKNSMLECFLIPELCGVLLF